MNREQKLELLKDWRNSGLLLDQSHDNIDKVLSTPPDAPFKECAWKMFDSYTATLAIALGADVEDLQYFHYECLFGERPMNVTLGTHALTINSLESLLELIEYE